MNAFTGETQARPGLPGLSCGGGSPEAGVEFPVSVWRLLMLNPLGKPHWGLIIKPGILGKMHLNFFWKR